MLCVFRPAGVLSASGTCLARTEAERRQDTYEEKEEAIIGALKAFQMI